MKKVAIFFLVFYSLLLAKNLNHLTYNSNSYNYIFKIFNFKTNISAVDISKNKNLHNFFKQDLNKWEILNKYNIDFYLIKGFKNYFPIERIIFYASHYCLNSNDKYNYCLVSTPFKEHQVDMIIYPDYKNQYPYDIYGYYIDQKLIIVYLNIDTQKYKYLNQNTISSNFEIEQQFKGINEILKYFRKINKNTIIVGNFYTDKNTLSNYIDQNNYSVLLNYRNLIISNKDTNKIRISLLENTHIIKPKKQNIKIFSKIDAKTIEDFAKKYKIDSKSQNFILYQYQKNIGNSIPIDIQIKGKENG